MTDSSAMNVYTLKGSRVKANLEGGYESVRRHAEKYLVEGQLYTVEETIVDSWSTGVYLVEFPGIKFNSVHFENIAEQSEDDDKRHPDYYRWNDE